MSTFRKIGKFFREIGEKIVHGRTYESAFREVALLMALATQRSFSLARSPEGIAWKPLKYRVGRPLIKTARMLNSVLAAMKNPVISSRSMEFRITTPDYVGYHQNGTRRIPARPFLGWSPDTVSAAGEMISQSAVTFVIAEAKKT
jgi:phage gpG-like protein